ncbi:MULTISPECIES: class I SAM-dependent methyltransferase [unclassified Aureimonas]|uniref:class I SAM-dependent methyltransferase n=1 Tax=unclassified Aureimonas TaxID=2615206 RepID=UPI001FCCF52D|nr:MULTISPECIES: SAM-dependent methyltransferase [unclassified Aureimonas]
MFGELLGAWALSAWEALGRPAPFVFAEMGPGRGTMMEDMLRTIRRIEPAFLKAARVTLVEASDRLARLQIERLSPFDLPIRPCRRLEEVGDGPLVLLANELFDAVAIRQFVRGADGWSERCVALGEDDAFVFTDQPLPPEAGARLPDAAPGTILEVSPAREAIATALGRRIAGSGGAALLVDYGHGGGFGDTLQAVKAHRFVDPLAEPGSADITSHVDFRALARRFGEAGLSLSPLATQGELLLSLGLLERAGRLGAGRPEAEQDALRAAVQRLAGQGPGEMGALFKALAVASRPLPVPPFASAASSAADPVPR